MDTTGEGPIDFLGPESEYVETQFRKDEARHRTWQMDGDCWQSDMTTFMDRKGWFSIMWWDDDDKTRCVRDIRQDPDL